ncbi:MAG: hypothetical protein VZR11_12875 [Succinimonas sp.]|nr:hypothetical protein [Succinimonas sp.]
MTNGVLSFAGRLPDKNSGAGAAVLVRGKAVKPAPQAALSGFIALPETLLSVS